MNLQERQKELTEILTNEELSSSKRKRLTEELHNLNALLDLKPTDHEKSRQDLHTGDSEEAV